MTKEKIEKLIAKGELKTALDELLAWTKGKTELLEFYNLLLSNAGRLADLERNKKGGELNHEKAAQLESQIRNAVVGILGQVPVSAWDTTETNAESKLGELRSDPLLLDFVKKHSEAYDHDPVLFTDFWEKVQEKYGMVRERDLLVILEDVHLALQEIPQQATRFVAQHACKWRTTQWVDFKDGIEEKYGTVTSVKELAALVEEKREMFEEVLKDFVSIKGGEFMMGAADDDEDALSLEKPQHRVRLSDFYISKYTIRLGQFAEFIRATGYQTVADKKDDINWQYGPRGKLQNNEQHPVIYVSWKDAIMFCNYWNKKYGFSPSYDAQGNLLDATGHQTNKIDQVYGFRLPSEAEWEYACRAGTTTHFYTGDTLNKDQANFNNHLGHTQTVGSYPANPWGIHDMLGNVWEWCQDVFIDQFYAQCQEQGVVENPLNLTGSGHRMLRGGGWFNHPINCRSSFRDSFQPLYRDDYISFRVVLCFPPGS